MSWRINSKSILGYFNDDTTVTHSTQQLSYHALDNSRNVRELQAATAAAAAVKLHCMRESESLTIMLQDKNKSLINNN